MTVDVADKAWKKHVAAAAAADLRTVALPVQMATIVQCNESCRFKYTVFCIINTSA